MEGKHDNRFTIGVGAKCFAARNIKRLNVSFKVAGTTWAIGIVNITAFASAFRRLYLARDEDEEQEQDNQISRCKHELALVQRRGSAIETPLGH